MKALWLVLTLLFATLSSVAQSASKKESTTSIYDDSDAYQVYSAILPITREMKLQGLGSVLIQQETLALVPEMDCGSPSGQYAYIASAFENYHVVNKASWMLVPKFDRIGPYEIKSSAWLRNGPRMQPPLQWIAVSAVGFNESHTIAVVYVMRWLESGNLYAAQKKAGKWEPIDWLNECGSIS